MSEYLSSIPRKFQAKQIVPIILLVIIAVLAFGLHYSPALYSDDWNNIAGRFIREDKWINSDPSRPLGYVPFYLLISIFSTNINGFYIVLFGLNIVLAVQLYLIALNLLPDMPVMALVIAALFEIYPAVYIHMWLTCISYFIVASLALFYGWFLLLYIQKGHIYYLALALLFLIISFTIVEAQLGIVLAWSVVLFLISQHANQTRRLIALIFPVILCGLFTVWRGYLALQTDTSVRHVDKSMLSTGILLDKLFLGFKVLVWGWTEPIRQIFHFSNNWIPLAIIVIFVLFFIIIAGYQLNRSRAQGDLSLNDKQSTLKEIRNTISLFVVGAVLIVAGYVPFIVVFIPNLSSTESRYNLFASIGASIMVAALLKGVSLLLVQNKERMGVLVATGAIPFILIGVVTQGWVQTNTQEAWVEQKQIWNELLVLAPNLADGTAVYFVVPGYEDQFGFANWQRLPLKANWEITGALQSLYGNKTLYGDVIYPQIATSIEPSLCANGIIPIQKDRLVPYSHALFILFDGQHKTLKVIENLQNDLALSWPTPTYKPLDLILTGQQPQTEWRILIEQ